VTAFFHLWRRELVSCFRTSIAYVIGVFFLIITGFSFWMLSARLAQGAMAGDMPGNLFGSPWFWLAMLIVTPLLTMRLFAEERRLGTLEMLLTAPVTETEVVLAKFAGAYSTFLLLWTPTLTYAFLLKCCGAPLPSIDWGLVAAGYSGTALVGAFFLSVGLLCSLLTRHQVVAAMGCLAALGILLSAGLAPFYFHGGRFWQMVRFFSAPLHMQDFAAGTIDTRTVIWYASSTVLLLFISIRILEARRLR
jgi:ABC-2 type transport system permease protein